MTKLILLTLIISGCSNTNSDPKAEVGGKYMYVVSDPFVDNTKYTFTIIEIIGDYSRYVMGNDTASMKSSLLMWKAKRIN